MTNEVTLTTAGPHEPVTTVHCRSCGRPWPCKQADQSAPSEGLAERLRRIPGLQFYFVDEQGRTHDPDDQHDDEDFAAYVARKAGGQPAPSEGLRDTTSLTAASVALLDKLTPHAPENADELRRRSAMNRRLALADDLRIIERAVRRQPAPSKGLRER